MLVENVVAQMLTAAGQKLYFYSNRDRRANGGGSMEIDFLLSRSKLEEKRNVIPIEVKNGIRVAHRSLDKFRTKFADYVAESYLLSVHDLKMKGGITFLPLYMAPLLPGGAVAHHE